jgi:hypothetical protein
MKARVLFILAMALWVSAGVLFLLSQFRPELAILRWVALADAGVAAAFTAMAAHKSFRH